MDAKHRKRFFTVEEAAKALCVVRSTIYGQVQKGKLAARREGRSLLILKSDVRTYDRARTKKLNERAKAIVKASMAKSKKAAPKASKGKPQAKGKGCKK